MFRNRLFLTPVMDKQTPMSNISERTCQPPTPPEINVDHSDGVSPLRRWAFIYPEAQHSETNLTPTLIVGGCGGQCLCRLPMGVYLSITGTTHIGLALRIQHARTTTECPCASRSWATRNLAEIRFLGKLCKSRSWVATALAPGSRQTTKTNFSADQLATNLCEPKSINHLASQY